MNPCLGVKKAIHNTVLSVVRQHHPPLPCRPMTRPTDARVPRKDKRERYTVRMIRHGPAPRPCGPRYKRLTEKRAIVVPRFDSIRLNRAKVQGGERVHSFCQAGGFAQSGFFFTTAMPFQNPADERTPGRPICTFHVRTRSAMMSSGTETPSVERSMSRLRYRG